MTEQLQDSTAQENAAHPQPRRFARKRMLALAGVATAALALGGLTACTGDEGQPKKDTDSAKEKDTDATDADTDADADAADDDATPGVFAAGETAVYESIGVKVTLSEPERVEPANEWDEFGEEGFTGYVFTVVVENGGDNPYSADSLFLQARAGEDGTEAESIYSSEHVGDGLTGTALPGNKVTGKVGFDVPDDAGFLTIELNEWEDITSKPAYWKIDF